MDTEYELGLAILIVCLCVVVVLAVVAPGALQALMQRIMR